MSWWRKKKTAKMLLSNIKASSNYQWSLLVTLRLSAIIKCVIHKMTHRCHLQLMTAEHHVSKPQKLCWGTNNMGGFFRSSSSWPWPTASLRSLATISPLHRCGFHCRHHPESLSSRATQGNKKARHPFHQRYSFYTPSRCINKFPSLQGWNWDSVCVTYLLSEDE